MTRLCKCGCGADMTQISLCQVYWSPSCRDRAKRVRLREVALANRQEVKRLSPCGCGCGQMVDSARSRGVPRRFATPECRWKAGNKAASDRKKLANAVQVMRAADPRLPHLSCPFRGPMGHCCHATAMYRTTDQRECFTIRVVHRACRRDG